MRGGTEPIRLDVFVPVVVELGGREVGRLRDWRSMSVGELVALGQDADAVDDLLLSEDPDPPGVDEAELAAELDRSLEAALAVVLDRLDAAAPASRGWWKPGGAAQLDQQQRLRLMAAWVGNMELAAEHMEAASGESSAPGRSRPARRRQGKGRAGS